MGIQKRLFGTIKTRAIQPRWIVGWYKRRFVIEWVFHIGVYRLIKPLHLPIAWHFYLLPQ